MAAFATPDIVMGLLCLAALAFLVEIANPGMAVPGALGVVLLIAAGALLQRLPTRSWGLVVLLCALVVLATVRISPDQPASAYGGAILFMVGGLVAFAPPDRVDGWVLLASGLATGAGALVTARTARSVRMSRLPVQDPYDYLGRCVVCERVDDRDPTTGQARIEGTWWTVVADQPLTPGGAVRVVGRRGLRLVVEPVDRAAAGRAEEPPCPPDSS